jgi:general secretion pathway protein A
MYNEYFGLEETPFSIAPDPRYLYMSEQHREALAHLVYGFNSSGGFVLLTGDVGTGKTTICRCLLEQIPENAAIAFIFNPKLTVEELLATICDEFGIKYSKGSSSIKDFVDLINAFLLETHSSGVKAVLIIDEAQNLSSDVLEQLRLLTNLETNQHKLLHVILLGQPELGAKLSEPELSQLSQRIIARYHLGPLSKKDIGAYVNHRLSVAGIHKQLFSESAINKLYQFTGGVPRLINVICDRALLGTYTQEQETVSRSTLSKAAHEVFGDNKVSSKSTKKSTIAWALMAIVLIAFGLAIASGYFKKEPDNSMTGMEIIPEPAVTSNLDNLNWTDMDEMIKSESLSFKLLLKLWDIDYTPANNIDACSRSKDYGLECMKGLRSLNILSNINRPAVLEFFDNDGKNYYVTLIGLDDNTAKISFGNEERTVAIKDIESQSLGDYTMFWKPPDGYNGAFRAWYEGPAVKWLRTSMSNINNGVLQDPVSNIYDNDLVIEVKKFQLAEGLVPDGIVGPLTLVHINTAIDKKVPLLSGRKEKN